MKIPDFEKARLYYLERSIYISNEIIKIKKVLKKTQDLIVDFEIIGVSTLDLRLVIENLRVKIRKLEKYCHKYVKPLLYLSIQVPQNKIQWKVFGEFDEENCSVEENSINYGPTHFSSSDLNKGYILLTELSFTPEGFLNTTKNMGLNLHTGEYLEESLVDKNQGKVTVKPMKELLFTVGQIEL